MMNIEKLAIENGAHKFRRHGDIGYSFEFTQPDLEAFAKALQQSSELCSSCNDTGDIHRADGEYLGKCPCKQSSELVEFAWYREGDAINPRLIEHINEHGKTVYVEFRMQTPPPNRGWKPLYTALPVQSEPVLQLENGQILWSKMPSEYTGFLFTHPPVQSSEPVAELATNPVFIYNHYTATLLIKDDAHPKTVGLVKGAKLFTHPPASVPLEKYNELLDDFKSTRKTLGVANEAGGQIIDTIWHKYTQTLFDFMDEAIAEAEGKEG